MAKLTAALFVLLAVVYGGTAYSQEQQQEEVFIYSQAPCATYTEMVKLVSKHGEKPLFIGEGLTFQAGSSRPFKGGMIFTVNQEEGNWTIFQVFADGMTCMLFNGSKFKPWMGD